MGAKRVSELFKKAKQTAPSIIFIDEIDAVGKSRGEFRNDEREATLNQLLMEMDGFEQNSGVIVMAATNRIEMLDDALLRSGRFDRRIHIALPDLQERIHTIELYLHNKPNMVDIEPIARMTVGFSAAALSTLVNEAALHAMREQKMELDNSDFEAVKERVIAGRRKILSFSDHERKIQAVYQSGKAVIATWLDVKFDKIGIVMTRLRDDEHEINSRTELINRIKVHLAGAVATEQVFGEQFSNASADIAEAIALSQALIHDHAMGEELLANSHEIKSILDDAYSQVDELLKKLNRARVQIEDHILEHESVDQQTIRGVLGDLF
jgi:ATP-dependent Zn protease